MTQQMVLLVEDEPVLAEIIVESLQTRGFIVTYAGTVKDALVTYESTKPDILILDVMLPDGDGFTLAKKIRLNNVVIPIIFLTSKSTVQDVITGFESGGNDYLKKPFSLEELIIRMQALLNRNRLAVNPNALLQTYQIGLYVFDHLSGTVHLCDQKKQLTTRESEILKMLIQNGGQLLNRKVLLLELWGADDYFTGRSLDVFMAKLRRYFKDDPSVNILNIRGKGYKLIY